MPTMNFDLEDGLPPVSFSLKPDDCLRFMAFMAECQAIKDAQSTPPAAQRKWVGLTDEDIEIAFDDTQEGGGFDDFARAIEAKLRSKNT